MKKPLTRQIYLLALCCIALITGCGKKEAIDVQPPEVTGPLTFSIQARNGVQPVVYTLNKYKYVVKRGPNGEKGFYEFVIMGHEDRLNLDMTISGRTATYDNWLNIAQTVNGQTVLYKDCNNETLYGTEGADEKGTFVKFSTSSTCLTTTMDSERRIDILTFSYQMPSFTLYMSQE